MRIETAFRTILASDAGVAAIVGGRIYRNKLPQNVTYPAIRFQLISTPWGEHRTIDGAALDFAKPRFQVDCWSAAPDGELALADAVFAALDGYHGTFGSPAEIRIDPIEIEDEGSDLEEGVGPSGADIYRQRLDAFVPYAKLV